MGNRFSQIVTQQPVVLIVDDDESVRKGLSNLLHSIGLRVQTFAAAPDFLAGELPHAPRCLILDVRLPGPSGLDFQAKLVSAKIDIPIIFITGHGDIPMTVRAMKAGAVEFLTKPLRDQDLLDAVQVALERDEARRRYHNGIAGLRAKFATLTPRERDVMACITDGLMNKQAAAKIDISENTVKVHRASVVRKMGTNSRAELVRMVDLLGVHTKGP